MSSKKSTLLKFKSNDSKNKSTNKTEKTSDLISFDDVVLTPGIPQPRQTASLAAFNQSSFANSNGIPNSVTNNNSLTNELLKLDISSFTLQNYSSANVPSNGNSINFGVTSTNQNISNVNAKTFNLNQSGFENKQNTVLSSHIKTTTDTGANFSTITNVSSDMNRNNFPNTNFSNTNSSNTNNNNNIFNPNNANFNFLNVSKTNALNTNNNNNIFNPNNTNFNTNTNFNGNNVLNVSNTNALSSNNNNNNNILYNPMNFNDTNKFNANNFPNTNVSNTNATNSNNNNNNLFNPNNTNFNTNNNFNANNFFNANSNSNFSHSNNATNGKNARNLNANVNNNNNNSSSNTKTLDELAFVQFSDANNSISSNGAPKHFNNVASNTTSKFEAMQAKKFNQQLTFSNEFALVETQQRLSKQFSKSEKNSIKKSANDSKPNPNLPPKISTQDPSAIKISNPDTNNANSNAKHAKQTNGAPKVEFLLMRIRC